MRVPTIAFLTTVSLAVAAAALAQNPRGVASTEIGGHKIAIDYGQPQLKGRDLAELMKKLPPDGIWRAGENQVTILSAAGDFMVEGTKVPAGKYSVYVHAGEPDTWSFILNKDLGVPLGKMWDQAPDNLKDEPWPHLGDYTEAIKDQEVVRAAMTKVEQDAAVDAFTMKFSPSGDGADLTLAWGGQAWKVRLQPAK